ncbi:hypothetical protein GH733_019408, partial [Mirounga leonina]
MEVNRASNPKAFFPESGKGNYPGFQNRFELPEGSHSVLQKAGEAYVVVLFKEFNLRDLGPEEMKLSWSVKRKAAKKEQK